MNARTLLNRTAEELLQDVIEDIAEIKSRMVTREDVARLPDVVALRVLRDVPGKADKKKHCALRLLAASLLDGKRWPERVGVARDFMEHVRLTPDLAKAFEAAGADLSKPGASKSFGQLLRAGEAMDLGQYGISRGPGNGIRGASRWRICRLSP